MWKEVEGYGRTRRNRRNREQPGMCCGERRSCGVRREELVGIAPCGSLGRGRGEVFFTESESDGEAMNREQDDPRKICYSPRILRNMAEICEEFGVGVKTVKSWIKQGAPIVVEGKGSKTRYCSEVSSLLVWRLARFRREV